MLYAFWDFSVKMKDTVTERTRDEASLMIFILNTNNTRNIQ